MIRTPGGWTVPHVTVDDALWIRATGDLNRALQAEFDLPVTTLYCLHYHDDRDNGYEELLYVLENQAAASPLPPNARWIEHDQLTKIEFATPHHVPIVDDYLVQVRTHRVPPLRPPWSRPGWLQQASHWMATELASLGYELLSAVEQINSWCLSSILRATTANGDVYLKAGPDFPLFVNEPAVVTGLSLMFPQNIPTPLSVDVSRRWMLLHDFGPPLGDKSTLELRSALLHQFAQLQQTAAEQTAHLLEIGCLDRRLHRLQDQIDGLLADVDLAQSLTDDECRQLRGAAPQLKAMCEQLAAFDIPETLNHGDLHLDNVAYHGGNLLFFDWTDACLAHPFLDMISIFNEKDAKLQAHLRDDYLDLWTDYASPQRLLQAWALAEPLFALHQAISYQSILAHLEETPKKAFGNVVPHYLRRAMSSLKE